MPRGNGSTLVIFIRSLFPAAFTGIAARRAATVKSIASRKAHGIPSYGLVKDVPRFGAPSQGDWGEILASPAAASWCPERLPFVTKCDGFSGGIKLYF
jgi:hypothetical protein